MSISDLDLLPAGYFNRMLFFHRHLFFLTFSEINSFLYGNIFFNTKLFTYFYHNFTRINLFDCN